MRRPPPEGFTLLEVLVALAIASIAAMGLLVTAQRQLSQIASLQDRTLAAIVASNELVQLQLQGMIPDNGGRDDQVDLGGQHWAVHLVFAPTPAPSVRRVDVQVGPRVDLFATLQPLYTLVGYVHLLPQGQGHVIY